MGTPPSCSGGYPPHLWASSRPHFGGVSHTPFRRHASRFAPSWSHHANIISHHPPPSVLLCFSARSPLNRTIILHPFPARGVAKYQSVHGGNPHFCHGNKKGPRLGAFAMVSKFKKRIQRQLQSVSDVFHSGNGGIIFAVLNA